MAPFFWPFAVSSRALDLPAVLARIQAEMPPALALALLRAAFTAVSHSARGRLNAPVGPSGGRGRRGRRDGGVRAEDAAARDRGGAPAQFVTAVARREVGGVRCDLVVGPEGVGDGELARHADRGCVCECLRWAGEEDLW